MFRMDSPISWCSTWTRGETGGRSSSDGRGGKTESMMDSTILVALKQFEMVVIIEKDKSRG
jgi:hypothetical protein